MPTRLSATTNSGQQEADPEDERGAEEEKDSIAVTST